MVSADGPAKTSSAPTVGTTAHQPGHGVDVENPTTEPTISTRPTTWPAALVATLPAASSRNHANANSAPAPNSHARVPNEKKAHGGEECVKTIDATNDSTVTAATTTAARRRGSRPRAATRSSNGHTR